VISIKRGGRAERRVSAPTCDFTLQKGVKAVAATFTERKREGKKDVGDKQKGAEKGAKEGMTQRYK
jgi:hypothetical protein